MAETGQGGDQSGSDRTLDIMYVWKIPVDRAYVKSITGILKVVIAIISLIAFICCASGRSETCDTYSSTYNFFEFVSISCFLTIITLWFFFVLTLDRRVFFRRVPWPLVELTYLGIWIIFYLIASIVIAAQSCSKDSNKAAAAFGFFAFFGLVGHAFFTFRDWRASRTAETSAPKSPEYDPDRNRELY